VRIFFWGKNRAALRRSERAARMAAPNGAVPPGGARSNGSAPHGDDGDDAAPPASSAAPADAPPALLWSDVCYAVRTRRLGRKWLLSGVSVRRCARKMTRAGRAAR
jgi:hypothetical protein